MICRLATFDQKPDASEEQMTAFRDWMKGQPGFKAAYHLHDPLTGKALSISIGESKEALLAMKDRAPPGGALNMKPTKVELFTDVLEF